MTAPKAIGSYIDALFPLSSFSFRIGETLESEEDKEHYARWIRDRAASGQLTGVSKIEPDGNAIYRRTMQLLDRLQEGRGCGTGINRTLWASMQTIVKLLACKRDWENMETGPIYGGSNATIANRLCLSVDRTKKILRDLRSRGLIIFHNRHGNGRRWIRRQANGQPVGHGFSLLPLLVLLGDLEAKVTQWREKRFEAANLHAEIVAEIAGVKQSLRAVHREAAREHPAFMACQTKLKAAATARQRGNIDELNRIAGELSIQRQQRCRKTTPERAQKNPPLSNHHQKHQKVDCQQDERSGDRANTSNFGLDCAKYGEGEIEKLFPVAAPYLKIHRQLGRAAQHIAQDTALPPDLWLKMCIELGEKAALVSVLMIAERMAAGEIRSTTAAYANGMLKAARRGDLQLGRSIWGRRELMTA